MTRPLSSHGRRRFASTLALACLTCALCTSTAGALTRASAPSTQRLAVLITKHSVYSGPSARSRVVETVGPRRPITGEQTVLPVLARSTGRGGAAWLRVMLPGRPNGSSGWIAQQGTRQAATDWRIRVDLGSRRVLVYRHGRIVKDFAAVVGKPSTPTPTGSFFVEETLQMRSGEPGGPFALALSARSDALQEFEGGPGQIAIHGRDNLGGVLGQAESHGCMRLGTYSIDWLAVRIGPGVPVSILP
jgi:lipoprotein-anchoring transpeptidase ErfK/SrfK